MEKSPESSPEFEFWMVGNPLPSFPHPQHLLTADELFADGVILPLNTNPSSSPPHETQPPPPQPPTPPPPQATAFRSKKWRQIFRSSRVTKEKAKIANTSSSSSSVGSAAELNIHIWPFSRSRSAGNAAVSSGSAAARPRAPASGRKSCSAPCSRSNSRGETPPPASKRWVPLAGGGIHVGRSAPVWQVRRAGVSGGIGINNNAKKSNVLNLNVNTCIGYGSQVRNCRGEDKEQLTGGGRTAGDGDGHGGGGGGRGGGGGGGANGSLFNLRAMFSKKVY